MLEETGRGKGRKRERGLDTERPLPHSSFAPLVALMIPFREATGVNLAEIESLHWHFV